jgi:hypothetical protein
MEEHMDGSEAIPAFGSGIHIDLAQRMVAIGEVRAAIEARQGSGIGGVSKLLGILEIRERSLRIILKLVFGRRKGGPERLVRRHVDPLP